MTNIQKCKLDLGPQPYNNPDVFPNNMYRCLHPRPPQHYPIDMDTVLSSLGPHQRHLDFHGCVRDDLEHLETKGVFKDKDHDFCINLYVGIFAPEELTVKLVNDHLIIEGKHEERQAHDMGYVTRHFKRRYELPKGYNPDAIVSKLSSDGVLKVTLPKATNNPKVRMIPIQYTGPNILFNKIKSVYKDLDKTKGADGNVETEDDEND